ncbi:hypothetical protein GCM10009558_044860 [Virgisporangium aurantiacum]
MERSEPVSGIAPGWYRDPVDPTIQRYWDGEGYLGEPLPADATPPPGPPADATPPPPPAQTSPTQTNPAQASPAQASPAPVSPAQASPAQTGQTQAGHTQGSHTQGSQTQGSQTQASQGGQAQAGQGSQTQDPQSQAPSTHGAGVANSAPAQISAPPQSPPPGPYPPGGPYQPFAPGQAGQQGPMTPPYGTPPPPGIQPGGPMPGWPAYPRLVLPAPRPHGYRLAGLGARFVARFVDTLAVLGLNILVNGYFVYQYYKINLPFWQEISRRFYAGESTAGVEPPERSSTLLIIILILAAALWFAYEVPAHANNGQTLGKRLLGIKVMRLESDEALGFRRSIRRWNTLGLPTLLWTCFGLGFVLQFVDCLWAAIDRPMHQALHDKSAVTVVVQAEPRPTPEQQTQPNHDQQGRPA